MTKPKPKERITDAMLDQIVGAADPTELFQSGALLGELRSQISGADIGRGDGCALSPGSRTTGG